MILTISHWRKKHPAYGPQLYKIQKRFEKKFLAYQAQMNLHTQKGNIGYYQKAQHLFEESQKEFEKVKKLELIATLSK
jgi:hypothetical protein